LGDQQKPIIKSNPELPELILQQKSHDNEPVVPQIPPQNIQTISTEPLSKMSEESLQLELEDIDLHAEKLLSGRKTTVYEDLPSANEIPAFDNSFHEPVPKMRDLEFEKLIHSPRDEATHYQSLLEASEQSTSQSIDPLEGNQFNSNTSDNSPETNQTPLETTEFQFEEVGLSARRISVIVPSNAFESWFHDNELDDESPFTMEAFKQPIIVQHNHFIPRNGKVGQVVHQPPLEEHATECTSDEVLPMDSNPSQQKRLVNDLSQDNNLGEQTSILSEFTQEQLNVLLETLENTDVNSNLCHTEGLEAAIQL